MPWDKHTMDGLIRVARQEVAAEETRAAIDAEKERIRARRAEPWWRRILPFTITITWRDQT